MSQPLSDVPYALVVDDDSRIRMLACDILADAGFRLFDAETGDAAIPILSAHHDSIVLLFTDVEMPGQRDGFALAREVAQAWPHVSVVVASGKRKPQPGELLDSATFIQKPFSADVVRDEVARILPDGRKPEPLKRKS